MPLTMALKLDKVMASECLPAVRTADQSFARLQALMLDAVGPLTDLLERINVSKPADDNEEEDQQGVDLQVVEDAAQTALVFLGNTATQFSAYQRTKILEEYNKDLMSFSEKVEPDLRAAAPLLFGSSFTKQASEHLSQVEVLRKVKGKRKNVISRPPCKDRLVGRGEQALSPTWIKGDVRGNSQEDTKMKIISRAKGSFSCSGTRVKGSDVFNTKCVNCESYIAETACFGLHSGTETCEQSSGGGKNFSLCH